MSGPMNQLLDSITSHAAHTTTVLEQIASIVRDLWTTSPASPDLDYVAQRIGDLAREESHRIPLGESELLDFFCSVVSTQGVRGPLIVQCLRIIGNSSADTDQNRAQVVASGCLPSIVSLLNDDSVLAFVVPVLFNICVDYEPAQKAIYQAGLNPELVSLISGPRLEEAYPLLDHIYKLLGFVATQEPEANLVHPATPFVLLNLADDQPSPVDPKDFLGQASVALTYLSQEQFQKSFLETPGSISLVLRTFSTACARELNASLEGPDDEAQLKQVQTVFTATLADLSAQPSFASSCSLDGPEVQTLRQWISTAHNPLQSAACLALGNIARSDEKCSYLVQQLEIHTPLVAILADKANVDAGLLHSVLGFLKNLAIPAPNKPVLGNSGLFEAEALPRIWELDTQTQVQFDAVSLTRLLLVGCPANVHRICAPVSDDDTSSRLQALIDLNARSDQEPTQMETARAITTACRVIHSTPAANHSSPPPDLDTFYANHKSITETMLRLGQQSKYPVLRSELLFALALMARTAAGAAAISQATTTEHTHLTTLIPFLTEVITGEKTDSSSETTASNAPLQLVDGKDSSTQLVSGLPNLEPQAPIAGTQKPTTMARNVDRENALVLVAELLQRCADTLPLDVKKRFEELLKEGGERVMHERGLAEQR
ncbi:armadillo-type protein [Astrocystis sublimbata]|nr:armadillo-type protein [Astrocystis sublimbata]